MNADTTAGEKSKKARTTNPVKRKGGWGGRRQGAGRKRNSLNRQSVQIVLHQEATGLMPLEIMLQSARTLFDAATKNPKRVNLDLIDIAVGYAKDAAAYCHPKMMTHEVGGKGGGAIPLAIAGSVAVYLPDNARRAANDEKPAIDSTAKQVTEVAA